MGDVRYAFNVTWVDPTASLLRPFVLFFYPKDSTVEMDDVKNRRKFLRRTPAPATMSERDFFIGATILVNARQLTVVDFGDEHTRRKFASVNQQTFGLIAPEALDLLPLVLDAVVDSNLRIGKLKMLRLMQDQAEEFCARPGVKMNASNLVSGPVVALELVGRNAVAAWQEACARLRRGPHIHASESPQDSNEEAGFFFGGQVFHPTVQLQDSSLLVIKPSSVSRGHAGKILMQVMQAGFEITGLELFTLNRANAEEFLEVYKGVVPAFEASVDEMVSSSCIACAVCISGGGGGGRGGGVNGGSTITRPLLSTTTGSLSGGNACVRALRDLCGPGDAEMARVLRPKTLRALYGQDSVDNAVHCTDLEEDGTLEVEYFFKILQ